MQPRKWSVFFRISLSHNSEAHQAFEGWKAKDVFRPSSSCFLGFLTTLQNECWKDFSRHTIYKLLRFHINWWIWLHLNSLHLQLTVYSAILLSLDTNNRYQKEKERNKRQRTKAWIPSWSHFRICVSHATSNIIVWTALFGNLQQLLIQMLITATFIVFLMDSWIMSVTSAARFLMQKYGFDKKRNPWGYTIFSLGTAIFIINWTLLLIHSLNDNLIPFEWGYDRFWRVTFAVYIGFSFCLESIYFRWGYKFVFEKNSAVNSIDIFRGAFTRPFFHVICVVVEYILCSIMLVFGEDGDISFYRFGIPFLLQIWLICLFFCAKLNRPSPCTWLELKLWRPIVECAWNIAIKNYVARNPNDRPPKLVWREKLDGNTNNDAAGQTMTAQDDVAQRQMKLHRTISTTTDI